MLKQITEYIDNNTDLVLGTTLFAGFFTGNAPDTAVCVIETGGATIHELPDYVEKTIQVLSRSNDYQVARANAMKVYSLIHGCAGISLPTIDGESYYLNVGQAVTAPQSVGQDAKGLFNISTNYIMRVQDA